MSELLAFLCFFAIVSFSVCCMGSMMISEFGDYSEPMREIQPIQRKPMPFAKPVRPIHSPHLNRPSFGNLKKN